MLSRAKSCRELGEIYLSRQFLLFPFRLLPNSFEDFNTSRPWFLFLYHQIWLRKLKSRWHSRLQMTPLSAGVDGRVATIGRGKPERMRIFQIGRWLGMCELRPNSTSSEVRGSKIKGFTVADAILVVGQTKQNIQWMYGENRDLDAR